MVPVVPKTSKRRVFGYWRSRSRSGWSSRGTTTGFFIGDEMLNKYKRIKRAELSRKLLSVAFGVKSPSTIHKRAGSLGRYVQWQGPKFGFAFPEESKGGAISASSFLDSKR